MDFTQYTCPVCHKPFQTGEDIVVCPECGAPHHRECYEQNGNCFYQDKHAEGFSYESLFPKKEESAQQERFEDFQTIVCPVCFHRNPGNAEFCQRCGTNLKEEKQSVNQNQDRQNTQQNPGATPPPFGVPFQMGADGMPQFDPLAGLDSKEPVGDGVTAGEAAKFTGKNTQYFSMVFSRIRKFGRSKFNFAAFLLSGVYFLYRKMYGLGIVFSLLTLASTVISTVIMMNPEWGAAVSELAQVDPKTAPSTSGYALYLLGRMGFVYLPLLINAVRYVLMLISGLTANRIYYHHSMKKIKTIKEENPSLGEEDLGKQLEAKGGVNLAIAVSFGIAILAISYLCRFFFAASGVGL